MPKALGIGGVFFRARDPDKLGAWYQKYLGISPAPKDMETPPWIGDGGVVVFAPFPSETDYFPEDRHFMVNFRVDDLDGLVANLEKAGIEASHRQDMAGIGRFARIHDPEGNPVELWEPAAEKNQS